MNIVDLLHKKRFAFDITYDSIELDLVASLGLPTGNYNDLDFNRDFTKLYLIRGENVAHQVDFSTAADLTSGTYSNKSLSVPASGDSRGCYISNDGTKFYSGIYTIKQYTLAVAYDLTTGIDSGKSLSMSNETTGSDGICFTPDETKIFSVGNTDKEIHQYNLSTAADISTATFIGAKEYTGHPNFNGLKLLGDKILAIDYETVVEIKGSDYDISTYNLTGNSRQLANATGLAINTSLNKIYLLTQAGKVRQYSYNIRN
jgi:hypothetical protein